MSSIRWGDTVSYRTCGGKYVQGVVREVTGSSVCVEYAGGKYWLEADQLYVGDASLGEVSTDNLFVLSTLGDAVQDESLKRDIVESRSVYTSSSEGTWLRLLNVIKVKLLSWRNRAH